MKMKGYLEQRLHALESRFHGSPKIAAYWRAFEGMSKEEVSEEIQRLENTNRADYVPDNFDRLWLNLSAAERGLLEKKEERYLRCATSEVGDTEGGMPV